MKKMNKIKWVNRKSMMACLEAGVIGKDIEARLKDFGLCMGHEPDSAEFSSLGGWVATRASGMRKNLYGNIEDIVVRIKFVTPQGTMERQINSPRVSLGPDINEIIMGSEGTFGVVTEVVVKVSEIPECCKYGSVVFPDFDAGVACLHEIAMRKCAPVSIRLVDNKQFQFGQALKPECTDMTTYLTDMAKKWYVTKVKNFKPEEMVAATLMFEGSNEEVSRQESLVYSIAKKYGGMPAGEENGIRGYFLTYMIAYLRDFGFEFNFLAESFETSVPWDCVPTLCRNVKQVIEDEVAKAGIKTLPLVSSRVTQLYDNGACVYFYFGFMWTGLKDPIKTFDRIEHAARDEILRLGGSLSHHHGIGKIRKHWMRQSVSPVGMHLLKGIKNTLDPQNIFGNGNLID